jgi:hypothetical protein
MPGGNVERGRADRPGPGLRAELRARFVKREPAGAAESAAVVHRVCVSFLLFNPSGTRFLNLELSALQADGAARSSPARA